MFRLFATLKKIAQDISAIKTNGVRLEQRTLLWTNPSPSAEFSAQTILNHGELNNYDSVEISFGGTFSIPNAIVELDGKSTRPSMCYADAWSTGYYFWRNINSTKNGLVFDNCILSLNNDSGRVYNSMFNPQKIYGIKYINVGG